jgi:hypothetical protein
MVNGIQMNSISPVLLTALMEGRSHTFRLVPLQNVRLAPNRGIGLHISCIYIYIYRVCVLMNESYSSVQFFSVLKIRVRVIH